MEIVLDKLEKDFKYYSILTVNQGQIRINPATKKER